MLETIETMSLPSARRLPTAYVQSLEQELLLASKVQAGLLPLIRRPQARLDLDARCAPARIVSGDFYDFVRYRGKAISAGALGDVSGKGASAAIYAALVVGILRSLEAEEPSPGLMLERLNRVLLQRPVFEHFVSLTYATWDERDRSFTLANAGLPYPIWIHNGRVAAAEVAGLPLGMFEAAEYQEYVIRCAPGDTIVFFTDGITDAVDANHEEFGRWRLEQLVLAHCHDGARKIVDAISAAVAAHAGDVHPFDDQTVIVACT